MEKSWDGGEARTIREIWIRGEHKQTKHIFRDHQLKDISHIGFNQEKLCYGSAKPKLHSVLL